MNPIIESLHQEAKAKAADYRRAESALIDVLMRLDEHKVFMHLGYASLYDYCLRELNLGESAACNFIAVARKARAIPELKSAVDNGNLSVAKARRIVPVLTIENSDEWLNKAKALTHKALEREIARQKPEEAWPDWMRYISEDRLAMQLSVPEELAEEFGRLRDLLTKHRGEPVKLERALAVAVGEYLDRHDPWRKAERLLKRAKENSLQSESKGTASEPAPANLPQTRAESSWLDSEELRRQHVKATLRREIVHRDQGRCTFVYPNGQRCKEQRYLEMHHLKPVSRGGENKLDNLVLLCSTHHKHWHLNVTAMGPLKPIKIEQVKFEFSKPWRTN